MNPPSSAKTVAAPRRPGAHAAVRHSNHRLTARAAVLAVVSLLLLTLAVAPLRALVDQRNDLADLQRQAQDLTERNAKLEARIDRFTDPAYLEGLARACLGMVRPGETAFVMVPTRGAPVALDC
jgi:cell division protein FtsB